MREITVRVLDGSGWSVYRDVRLRALAESPASFTATLAEEADRDEQFWRDRMARSHRLLAERGPVHKESSASDLTSRSPQRERSSACTSSQRHGAPASPGDSSRLPRHWRPSRLTYSSTTGWNRQRASDRLRQQLRVPRDRLPPPSTQLRPRTWRGDRHGAVAGARRHIGAEPD